MSLKEIKEGAIFTKKYGLPIIIRHDYSIDENNVDSRLIKYILQSIDKFIKFIPKDNKDISILDIGAGDGIAMQILEELGYKNVKGIDLYPTYDKITKGNFHNLDKYFKENQFDAIFLNHTLEHSENPLKLISKIFKVLKKDGIIFIAVPNINYPWAYKKEYSTTHFSGFNGKFLEGLMSRFGFKTLFLKEDILLKPIRKEMVEVWYVGKNTKKYNNIPNYVKDINENS